MNVKYERQLKKGIFEILVLSLLAENDKYGYQLISEMEEKSGGMFKVKEGTLYPILYRLEDAGLVVSKWSEPKEREMVRKYYSITMAGIVVLDDIEDILAVNECAVGVDLNVRIYSLHGLLCGLHLSLADISGGVYHLPLEVGEIHLVSVCDTDGSNARSREVQRRRGAETARADYQHLCVEQLLLTLCADFLKNDVTGVAFELFVCECHY